MKNNLTLQSSMDLEKSLVLQKLYSKLTIPMSSLLFKCSNVLQDNKRNKCSFTTWEMNTPYVKKYNNKNTYKTI